MVSIAEFKTLEERFYTKKAEKEHVKQALAWGEKEEERLEKKLAAVLKARLLIQSVAEEVQKSLEIRLSHLVSAALAAVYDSPEQFLVEFVQRRGKTECDMLFVKGNKKMDPIGYTGGGVLDVTCFALKVACLTLCSSNRPTRMTLWADEPFGDLSYDLQSKASKMLQSISTNLNLQLVIVSHEPDIIVNADRVFSVRIDKEGISHVTQE